ncbi:MAG: leucyl aminopeptidase [Chlamydiota bacterium]
MVGPALASGDFLGKNGEGAFFYLKGEKEARLLALGLGKREKNTTESLRRAFASAVRLASAKKVKTVNIFFPHSENLKNEESLRGIWEGILLANYAFTHLKHDSLKENPVVLLEKIGWIGLHSKDEVLLDKLKTIVSSVDFARDLINGNADDVTPHMLVETALELEKKSPKIQTTIFDKKRLEQEKMGLLLAVNRASNLDPFLIQTSYRGNPHSKDHIVLVGKGITYDTGGLSLKTSDGMMTMKCDMSGAATVLGAVSAAAALHLKVNVTAVAPVTENSIGPKSYKLGDVYRSYSGKTVEINNTDAEGRLVLADAISYAVKNLEPTCLIDLASLTGAIVVALGEEISGFFASDELLSKDLMAASEKTGELLWRMPLHADYKEALKSDIADLINTGGRDAGSIKAALFLQEFIGTVPWAHIDFAGPCYLTRPKYYNPMKGTGFGVRLLVDFLERRSS